MRQFALSAYKTLYQQWKLVIPDRAANRNRGHRLPPDRSLRDWIEFSGRQWSILWRLNACAPSLFVPTEDGYLVGMTGMSCSLDRWPFHRSGFSAADGNGYPSEPSGGLGSLAMTWKFARALELERSGHPSLVKTQIRGVW